MAAQSDPKIRSVTPSELTLTPGQSVAVVGDTFHPDDRVIEGAFKAESGGKSAQAPVRVSIVHPMTHSLTFTDKAIKVEPDPANPARFVLTYVP